MFWRFSMNMMVLHFSIRLTLRWQVKSAQSKHMNHVHHVNRFSYAFLAFRVEEQVTPDRQSCEMLLQRIKLDGWAVGRTKVFLKYYHVEYLSKLYSQQVNQIVQVQACVRRWLVNLRLKRYDLSAGIYLLHLNIN